MKEKDMQGIFSSDYDILVVPIYVYLAISESCFTVCGYCTIITLSILDVWYYQLLHQIKHFCMKSLMLGFGVFIVLHFCL